jgi:hypothetical protein
MKARKMSQTVLLENPDSAQASDRPAVGTMIRRVAARVIPTTPTTDPGSGSVISAAMTATKRAK